MSNAFNMQAQTNTLGCNAPNISVGDACSITYDELVALIVAVPNAATTYQIDIEKNGVLIWTGTTATDIFDASLFNCIGQMVTVTVTDLGTGNSCWHDVLVEDKFKPVITCMPDVISCADDPDTTIINAATATDNCCATTDITINSFRLSEISGFVGPLADAEWTPTVNAAQGESAAISNNSLVIIGADNTAGTISCGNPSSALARPIANASLAACYTTEYCITVPATGSIAFDWLIAAAPGSGGLFSNSDPAAYSVNGDYFQLSSMTLMSGSQSGIQLTSGDEFCFVVGSDGSANNSQVTFNNLVYQTASSQCEEYCFYRRWVATDCNGNTSDCYQKVTVEQRDLTDVVFPADTIISCGNGIPTPDMTGRPEIDGNDADGVCMINVFPYEDQIDQICENSFKIIRTWTVMDWCETTDNIIERVQLIKVLDTLPPTYTCPADLTLSTDAQNCSVDHPLPGVSSLLDNCSSSANITVVPSCNGCTINLISGSYVATDLAPGVTTITYTVTDDCDNSSTCSFNITVEDQICPSMQGNSDVVATIQLDGVGRVNASSFNGGSRDLCSPQVWFKVLRMEYLDSTPNGSTADQTSPDCVLQDGDDDAVTTGNQVYFDDFVSFCCTDVGSTTAMVVLRGFDADPGTGAIDPALMAQGFLADANGDRVANFCDVMVPVDVQDKQSPLLMSALPDITVSCNFVFDSNNLSASFGTVVTNLANQNDIIINDVDNTVNTPQPFNWGKDGLVTDNCDDNLTIQRDSVINLDSNCNTGTITRTFTVSSGTGTPVVTTQTITVQDFDPFAASDITWLGDQDIFLTATECNPDLTNVGAPTFTADNCSKPAPAITNELEFTRPLSVLGAGMCKKILRTWVVRDWCQPGLEFNDPILPNGEQTIVVWDLIAPTIAFSASNQDCDTIRVTTGTTSATWTQQLTITDNCTSVFDATNVSYQITEMGGNVINGTGTTVSQALSMGTHQAIFTAVDSCGTEGKDTIKIVVLEDPCMNVTPTFTVNLEAASNIPVNVPLATIYNGTVPSGTSFNVPGIGTGANLNIDCSHIDVATRGYPSRYSGTVNIPITGTTNVNQCEILFRVQDVQAPILGPCQDPSAINPIELDASNQAVINLSDVQPTTFSDNCTASGNIVFSLTPLAFIPTVDPAPVATTTLTIDCSMLNTFGERTITVYARDEVGQQSTCNVTLRFKNSTTSNCANALPATNQPAIITGQILDEENGQVQNVSVSLNGNVNRARLTGEDGLFQFQDIPTGENYSISPAKDDQPLNGVSTYDLVKISQHVLGIEELSSPYKMIAADANRSGNITAFDLVEIRKLILFIHRDFQETTSWRFIDADYLFPTSNDPFGATFPEVYNINNLQEDMLINFVAVKTGDVNCSARPNRLTASEDRNAEGELNFQLKDTDLKAGELYEVPFYLDPTTRALGYQFTLEFDQDLLKYAELETGNLPSLNESNFGLSLLDQGVITTSWASSQAMQAQADEALFTLHFRAKRNGRLSKALSASSRFTAAEAYGEGGSLLDVALRFDNQETALANSRTLLYQNRPNPFKEATTIGFYLPKASPATLSIYDVSGKQLINIQDQFEAGYNELHIDKSKLDQAGVFYYQLQTPEFTAVKKMTVIE